MTLDDLMALLRKAQRGLSVNATRLDEFHAAMALSGLGVEIATKTVLEEQERAHKEFFESVEKQTAGLIDKYGAAPSNLTTGDLEVVATEFHADVLGLREGDNVHTARGPLRIRLGFGGIKPVVTLTDAARNTRPGPWRK